MTVATSLRRNLVVFLQARLPAQSYQRDRLIIDRTLSSTNNMPRARCHVMASHRGVTLWRDVCC